MTTLVNNLAVAEGKKSRELGVELLRIIAMFLIVCQHFMNHGGFIKNAGENLFFLNLLHVLFAPSVNVFVLITGYFSINSRKLKLNKIALLWFQVLFYSLIMLLVAEAFGVAVSDTYVFQSFFPIIYRRYWFFTAYILLMLLTPFLSAMLNAISQKEHLALVIGIFLCGYVSTRFDINATLSLNSGYSILWFCLLFIVGAYLKKYPVKIHKALLALVYVICSALLLFFKYYCTDTKKLIFKLFHSTTDYNQPLVLLAAICLFLLFLGIKSNGKRFHRFLCYVSSLTFGVYLIHEAPIFRSVLYNAIFETSKYHGLPNAVLYVLLFAAITFVVCCLIDSLRTGIFALVRICFKKVKEIAKSSD